MQFGGQLLHLSDPFLGGVGRLAALLEELRQPFLLGADGLFVLLHLEEQSPGLVDLALEVGDLRGEWQQFLLRGRNPVRLLTHIDRLNGEPVAQTLE